MVDAGDFFTPLAPPIGGGGVGGDFFIQCSFISSFQKCQVFEFVIITFWTTVIWGVKGHFWEFFLISSLINFFLNQFYRGFVAINSAFWYAKKIFFPLIENTFFFLKIMAVP